MPAPTEFRFRLNGRFMPETRIERSPEGRLQIAVRDEDLEYIGWFTVSNGFETEYRDETAWQLVPIPMRQEPVTKGWYQTTSQEFIEILFAAAVIR
jgi:hypothetical protein